VVSNHPLVSPPVGQPFQEKIEAGGGGQQGNQENGQGGTGGKQEKVPGHQAGQNDEKTPGLMAGEQAALLLQRDPLEDDDRQEEQKPDCQEQDQAFQSQVGSRAVGAGIAAHPPAGMIIHTQNPHPVVAVKIIGNGEIAGQVV